MARCARIKSSDSIFHIMIRSIPEVNLFEKDSDKEMYLSILKYYQHIYHFKVYAYCLMSNHAHFIIDANGADISRIMHNINFRYSMKFNKKYKRRGHLFQDRFKSKVITNERYLITVSAYIHRNPVDIISYKEFPEKYKYSSLSIYLGLKKDSMEIVDEGFIMQLFSTNGKKARKRYKKFIYLCDDKKLNEDKDIEKHKKKYEHDRNIIKRNLDPETLLKIIESEEGIDCSHLYQHGNNKTINSRAFSVVILRGLCNLSCSDIANILGDIPLYAISELCNLGVWLIRENGKYKTILNNILMLQTA